MTTAQDAPSMVPDFGEEETDRRGREREHDNGDEVRQAAHGVGKPEDGDRVELRGPRDLRHVRHARGQSRCDLARISHQPRV